MLFRFEAITGKVVVEIDESLTSDMFGPVSVSGINSDVLCEPTFKQADG